ncbi:MAG: hypothetical protein M9890_14710 [Thermomicrobiales bacterium]|nr:hypothetical protein [Thermomicrobiales bacterium]
MNAFFLLYALTISVELVLTIVMLVFLYLIVAPVGGASAEPDVPTQTTTAPAESVEQALAQAFATVSQQRDDLLAITTARAMLVRFAQADEQRDNADR